MDFISEGVLRPYKIKAYNIRLRFGADDLISRFITITQFDDLQLQCNGGANFAGRRNEREVNNGRTEEEKRKGEY